MPGEPNQPTDVCGVDALFHEGALTRIVVALQPTFGAGLPFRFTVPIWEEEVTVCAYHLNPPDYEPPPDPLPVGWTAPAYRLAVAAAEGIPVRLVWDGEIVE